MHKGLCFRQDRELVRPECLGKDSTPDQDNHTQVHTKQSTDTVTGAGTPKVQAIKRRKLHIKATFVITLEGFCIVKLVLL